MDNSTKSRPWFHIYPSGWLQKRTLLDFQPIHWKGWLAMIVLWSVLGGLLYSAGTAGWMRSFAKGALVIALALTAFWLFRRFVVEPNATYFDARRPQGGNDLRSGAP